MRDGAPALGLLRAAISRYAYVGYAAIIDEILR